MREQGEKGRTEHTLLRCACVQHQCGRCEIPSSPHLSPVGEASCGENWGSHNVVGVETRSQLRDI